MFPLLQGQAQAVAEKALDQNDDVTAVRRPAAGFFEGQGHVMVAAAFAATDAGKVCVHGGSVTRQGQRAR
ncbi:hypothetical protein RS3R2_03100 [Pseudomonas lactis]|nr:hypothetical protein RS3R2_03100 [Pseudomonas lactis]